MNKQTKALKKKGMCSNKNGDIKPIVHGRNAFTGRRKDGKSPWRYKDK